MQFVYFADQEKSSHLKWVIDITIGYPNRKALDLMQIILGVRPPCKTVLHYRKYPIAEVPTDDEGLLKWMYARYVEKEEMLSQYHSNGKFPIKNESDIMKTNGHVIEHAKEVTISKCYLILLHIVYAAILWFHYKWISVLYRYTIGMVW